MDALHVIALVEGVDRGLPVAVPFDRDVARLRHAVEIVRVEMLRYRTQELAQRRWRVGKRVPGKAAPGIAVHLLETVRRAALGEGVDIRDAPVTSVELVLPVVVGAGKRVRRAGAAEAAGPQPITAVLADVVESPHATVPLTHD